MCVCVCVCVCMCVCVCLCVGCATRSELYAHFVCAQEAVLETSPRNLSFPLLVYFFRQFLNWFYVSLTLSVNRWAVHQSGQTF